MRPFAFSRLQTSEFPVNSSKSLDLRRLCESVPDSFQRSFCQARRSVAGGLREGLASSLRFTSPWGTSRPGGPASLPEGAINQTVSAVRRCRCEGLPPFANGGGFCPGQTGRAALLLRRLSVAMPRAPWIRPCRECGRERGQDGRDKKNERPLGSGQQRAA